MFICLCCLATVLASCGLCPVKPSLVQIVVVFRTKTFISTQEIPISVVVIFSLLVASLINTLLDWFVMVHSSLLSDYVVIKSLFSRIKFNLTSSCFHSSASNLWEGFLGLHAVWYLVADLMTYRCWIGVDSRYYWTGCKPLIKKCTLKCYSTSSF